MYIVAAIMYIERLMHFCFVHDGATFETGLRPRRGFRKAHDWAIRPVGEATLLPQLTPRQRDAERAGGERHPHDRVEAATCET